MSSKRGMMVEASFPEWQKAMIRWMSKAVKIWKKCEISDSWKCCLSRGQAHPTIECLDIIATVRPDTWLRIVPMWTQEEEVDRTVWQRFAVDRVSSTWTIQCIEDQIRIVFDNFFFFYSILIYLKKYCMRKNV